MLNEALTQMLTRLGQFLPTPAVDLPLPGVSVVRLQQKAIGLGGFHTLESREFFPAVHKGLRLAGTVRFQLWGGGSMPSPVEQQLRLLTETVLGDRDTLEVDGFLDLQLTGVSTADHVGAVPAWRQTADFDVLYEFRRETSDDAGGLIARIPVALEQAWGSFVSAGDIVVWHDSGTTPLRLEGPRTVEGVATLEFLPTAAPAGAVTLTRTHAAAVGAPTDFATLDDFLTAVGGPTPASTHARVSFASLSDFLAALGPAGDPLTFLDEAGAPRLFPVRGRLFTAPIALATPADTLEIAFEATALDTDQVLYLRASRGRTTSP